VLYGDGVSRCAEDKIEASGEVDRHFLPYHRIEQALSIIPDGNLHLGRTV
jgi:hypothetical protein